MSDLVGNPEDRFSRFAAQLRIKSSEFISELAYSMVQLDRSVVRHALNVYVIFGPH